MKTMKTTSVAQWLTTQGMPQAAAKFTELFSNIPEVDYDGMEGFLTMVYGPEDANYVFRKIQCDVVTTMNFNL